MAEGGGLLPLRGMGRLQQKEPDPTTDVGWLQRISEDIRALREEYVVDRLLLRLSDNLPNVGDSRQLDTQDKRASFLIVSVFTGQLDIFIGEGAVITSTPHFRYAVTLFPIIIPLAVQPYKFTAIASAASTAFTIFAVS